MAAALAQVSQQSPQNVFDLRADRGRGESDVRHRWTNSYLYELRSCAAGSGMRACWAARDSAALTGETGNPVTAMTAATTP